MSRNDSKKLYQVNAKLEEASQIMGQPFDDSDDDEVDAVAEWAGIEREKSPAAAGSKSRPSAKSSKSPQSLNVSPAQRNQVAGQFKFAPPPGLGNYSGKLQAQLNPLLDGFVKLFSSPLKDFAACLENINAANQSKFGGESVLKDISHACQDEKLQGKDKEPIDQAKCLIINRLVNDLTKGLKSLNEDGVDSGKSEFDKAMMNYEVGLQWAEAKAAQEQPKIQAAAREAEKANRVQGLVELEQILRPQPQNPPPLPAKQVADPQNLAAAGAPQPSAHPQHRQIEGRKSCDIPLKMPLPLHVKSMDADKIVKCLKAMGSKAEKIKDGKGKDAEVHFLGVPPTDSFIEGAVNQGQIVAVGVAKGSVLQGRYFVKFSNGVNREFQDEKSKNSPEKKLVKDYLNVYIEQEREREGAERGGRG
jgi:hypothetical protein